jgi:16S rRNA (uracil1498-N3)-methyltransferase
MSERFYLNCPLQPGSVEVTGPEAHHLAVVCRLRPDDLLCLFNGDGHEYPATVVAGGRKRVELDVLRVERPERELPFQLEVAAPVPKGDRGQFLIEKLTELGVTTFVPLRTARSVVHPAGLERMRRYVIEASKQCGRNMLMQIRPVALWEDYCGNKELPAIRILADPSSSARLDDLKPEPGQGLAFAVGPEGGFTEDEIGMAQRQGWRLVALGPRTLRIETAAVALASWAALASINVGQ